MRPAGPSHFVNAKYEVSKSENKKSLAKMYFPEDLVDSFMNSGALLKGVHGAEIEC